MSNPIFSTFQNSSQPPRSNNSFVSSWRNLLNQVKGSSNPNAIVQQWLTNSTESQKVRNYINQNGGDAKTAFYNLAAQMGVNPDTIINELNQFMRIN